VHKPIAEVPAADAAVVPAVDAVPFMQSGELQPLPVDLSAADHPCKLAAIIDAYRWKLTQWGTQSYALPLTGDGSVTVYRADLFADPARQREYRGQTGTTLAAPGTWEDIQQIGQFLTTANGKPALPPLPSEPGRLLAQFNQIAACYDRRPAKLSEIEKVFVAARSFHMDLDKGTNRLLAPSFVAAADWFHNTRTLRPAKPGDPLDALIAGTAVLAVVPLAELVRLPRIGSTGGIDPRFGLAAQPGTRTYFDEKGKTSGVGGRNYVPFLGVVARVGVVLSRSKQAEAAWDFFAELAGPAGNLLSMARPAIGCGPFRIDHSNEALIQTWEAYGFDAPRTKVLADAMRDFAPVTDVNPAMALRTPDQAQRMTLLEKAVRSAATGELTSHDALTQASQDWTKLDRAAGDSLKVWLRKANGQE